MSKITVVYWSGTGNTAMMASAIAEGIKDAGSEASLVSAEEVNITELTSESVLALGCPSMGAEQLEETVMEPLMCDLDGIISGKKIALFGSYGWGDGEWMRDWEKRITSDGASIVNGEGLIVNSTPSDDDLENCKTLGRTLASL